MKTVSKRFLVLMLALLTIIACCGFSANAQARKDVEEEAMISALEIEEVIDEEFKIEKISDFIDENLNSYTKEEIELLIEKYQQAQEQAHALAEAARILGWPENSEAILSAQTEWFNAQTAINFYKAQYKVLLQQEYESIWAIKAEEYPVATEIWLYMKALGWSDYVCAGILGNMMAEVGGGTLNLIAECDTGNGFYGVCQWSKTYYSGVWGADLVGQCDYLRDTIKYEIDTFGYAYSKGFNYESFLELTDEREAAYAFAVCYERCTSRHRYIRKDYAEKAYDYFVGK